MLGRCFGRMTSCDVLINRTISILTYLLLLPIRCSLSTLPCGYPPSAGWLNFSFLLSAHSLRNQFFSRGTKDDRANTAFRKRTRKFHVGRNERNFRHKFKMCLKMTKQFISRNATHQHQPHQSPPASLAPSPTPRSPPSATTPGGSHTALYSSAIL